MRTTIERIKVYCQKCGEIFEKDKYNPTKKCVKCSIKKRAQTPKRPMNYMTPDQYANNVLNSIHESKRKDI